MNHAEIDALTNAFAPVVKEFVAKALRDRDAQIRALQLNVEESMDEIKKLIRRVGELTIKEGPQGPPGPIGPQGPAGERGADGAAGPQGPAGIDGKDGVAGADGLPGADGAPGKDGADGRDGADGVAGQDGAVGPAGRDGVDGAPGARGDPGAPGADGHDGKDGAPGSDGEPGRDGRDGLPGLNGKDGLDGKDGAPGRDGFGFDDMTVEDFDEHFELRFVQGERVKVFTLKKPTRSLINSYRGIWREGSYQKGDCVTHGGSLHIAHEDTSARPETSPTWQVICKRGGAGRDGKDGRNGERGPQGVPGKDLTQMGLDGTKWR